MERIRPFTLFGDSHPGTDYFGENLCPGDYKLRVIPYYPNIYPRAFNIDFKLRGGLDIQELILVNASSNQDIGPLTETIPTLDGGISVRAEVSSCVNSVKFVLRRDNSLGEELINHVENTSPYTLLGDESNGNYIPWQVPGPGRYVLQVTAYNRRNGRGLVGQTKEVVFDYLATDNVQTEDIQVVEIYPNPSSQKIIHLSFKENLNGKALLKVFDKQGELKLEKEMTNTELDLDISHLDAGYYTLQINTSYEVYTKTLIKY